MPLEQMEFNFETTPSVKKQKTFVDIFCGIGGFHSAAIQLGMKCVFACDIDKSCRSAYSHNYGIMPESDILKVEASAIPDHDILLAGFPCQSFSIAGHQAGFDDARGTLFFELVRIIEAKSPSMFLLENVKHLIHHDKGQTLKRILEILKSLGYWVDYKVLNSLDFGLPHRRKRIFIVGIKGSVGNFTWPSQKLPMKPLSEILEENPDPKHLASDAIVQSRKAAHSSKFSPSIWRRGFGGKIDSHPFSGTLLSTMNYNYLLVDGVRRLTSREKLRLQGFPESFEITCSDSQVLRQAGNAVSVPVVKAVLAQILESVG